MKLIFYRRQEKPRDMQSNIQASDDLFLPLEMIMHIMKQLPDRQKTNMMQTCKVLYRYGCELLSNRSPLVLYVNQASNSNILEGLSK